MSIINRTGYELFEYSRRLTPLPCEQLDGLNSIFVIQADAEINSGIQDQKNKSDVVQRLLKLKNKSYVKEYLRISILNSRYENLYADAPEESGCITKREILEYDRQDDNKMLPASQIRRSNQQYIKYLQGVLKEIDATDYQHFKPSTRVPRASSRQVSKSRNLPLGSTTSDALWLTLRSKA